MAKMLYKPGVQPVEIECLNTGSLVVDGDTYTYIVVSDDAKVKGWSDSPKPSKKTKADD